MFIEEDEDVYITSTDYDSHFELEDIPTLITETGHAGQEFSNLNYQNLNELNNNLKSKGEGDVFVLHINARSLVKNFDEIESLILKTNTPPDVICISETRFKDKKIDWQSQLADLSEYKLAYDNSPTNAGGVAIYIKNMLNFKVKHDLRLEDPHCESHFIEIDISTSPLLGISKTCLLIGCVYRHPRYTIEKVEVFLRQLIEKLDGYCDQNIPLIIMGDINIDTSKPNLRITKKYLDALASMGCCNLIKSFTRFEKKRRSILDHIITNYDENKIEHGVLLHTITDHLPVYAVLKCRTNSGLNVKNGLEKCVKWQKLDESKKEFFKDSLQNSLIFFDPTKHPEQMLADLTSITNGTVNYCFPPKILSNRAKKKAEQPWVDKEIQTQERMQAKLFRKFVQSDNPQDYKNYNSFRKKLAKKKRRKKRAYFRELIKVANSKHDFRKTWQAINKVLKKGSKKLKTPTQVVCKEDGNEKVTKCPKTIANIMNKHFAGIAKKLAAKLKNSDKNFRSYLGRGCKKNMYFKYIEVHEILEEIRNICEKKAMGFDNIPPKIIKWAPEIFASILQTIFNKCLSTGYYPQNMKVARVVPIHKEGDINDVNNYRPISILTQFNRIFERIISKRLMSFFEKNKIITSKQFGFLKKHSTEHAILDLKEYLLGSLDKQKISAVLFLDLQKAFDTVSHDILLHKLKHYGVRGLPHQLLSSYLTNRQQYTSLNGVKSDLEFVRWGVPQGSVLGPLLFLLFINDLSNSTNMNSWFYADDTALAASSTSFKDLEVKFNQEVNKVQDWLLANKLSAHYGRKTQYILFIPRSKAKDEPVNFMLHMGGHIIEQTSTYKYLGIFIDEKLNWEPQIEKMCAKLASVCGILSKVRHFLDRNSLMLIYNSLVESRLRYGILSWSTASDHQLNRLKVLQNRALRFIDFSSIGTYMPPLYFHYKVLQLNDLIKLQRVTYMYCYQNNELPFVFNSYFSRPSHSHDTRYACTNYSVHLHGSNYSKTSMEILGQKTWADVLDSAKALPFRKAFSQQMKQNFLNDLPRIRRTKQIERNLKNTDYDDLRTLFSTCDDEGEFYGFCDSGLSALFDITIESENDFLGFNCNANEQEDGPPGFYTRDTLFDTTTSSESENDFFGFASHINNETNNDNKVCVFGNELINLFDTTAESEADFLGF